MLKRRHVGEESQDSGGRARPAECADEVPLLWQGDISRAGFAPDFDLSVPSLRNGPEEAISGSSR